MSYAASSGESAWVNWGSQLLIGAHSSLRIESAARDELLRQDRQNTHTKPSSCQWAIAPGEKSAWLTTSALAIPTRT